MGLVRSARFAGDTVLAYDHQSGTWSERSVEGFNENIYDGPLFTVHTESGTVRTTIYHPFWVLSGYDLEERQAPRELSEREDQGLSLPGRWVNSHELRCGDVLIGQNGEQQTVLRIEQEFVSGFLVHNLTIREDHTFAVGPDAVLVHNTGGCGGLSSTEAAERAKALQAGIDNLDSMIGTDALPSAQAELTALSRKLGLQRELNELTGKAANHGTEDLI